MHDALLPKQSGFDILKPLVKVLFEEMRSYFFDFFWSMADIAWGCQNSGSAFIHASAT